MLKYELFNVNSLNIQRFFNEYSDAGVNAILHSTIDSRE